jgi:hypothetical protein
MKQKKILLMLAVAAIMAACEPEQVVTPEPEAPPSGPTYLTSMVGTVWHNHYDYWISAAGVDYHFVGDKEMSFITDTTGVYHAYSPGDNYLPPVDSYNDFFYLYDPEIRIGLFEIDENGNVSTDEFLYDPTQDAIIFPADTNASSHVVYYRVY